MAPNYGGDSKAVRSSQGRNSKEGDNEKMRRKMPKLLEYSTVMAIVWVGVCSWMILQYLRAR